MKKKYLVFLSLLLLTLVFLTGCSEKLEDIPNEQNETEEQTNILNIRNNIQASHNDVDFYLSGDEFVIYEADDYGELTGNSMQPTFFTGNILIEKRYNFANDEQLNEGQIIRFKDRQGDYTVHRIKAVYDDYYLTQGDNNNYIDEKVYPEEITHVIVGILFK